MASPIDNGDDDIRRCFKCWMMGWRPVDDQLLLRGGGVERTSNAAVKQRLFLYHQRKGKKQMKVMMMKEIKTNINEGKHGALYFFPSPKSHRLMKVEVHSILQPANHLTPNSGSNVEKPMNYNREMNWVVGQLQTFPMIFPCRRIVFPLRQPDWCGLRRIKTRREPGRLLPGDAYRYWCLMSWLWNSNWWWAIYRLNKGYQPDIWNKVFYNEFTTQMRYVFDAVC